MRSSIELSPVIWHPDQNEHLSTVHIHIPVYLEFTFTPVSFFELIFTT